MPKGEPIASYVIHKGICERAIQALEKQIPIELEKQGAFHIHSFQMSEP